MPFLLEPRCHSMQLNTASDTANRSLPLAHNNDMFFVSVYIYISYICDHAFNICVCVCVCVAHGNEAGMTFDKTEWKQTKTLF